MIQFNSTAPEWTPVDLLDRFGEIPLHRLVLNPPPGTATVEDAVRLNESKGALLYELVDGTLVEKTMGAHEALLAAEFVYLLKAFMKDAQLGIVMGADGMMKLFPDQIRIPDVSFISWEHLKNSGFPEEPAPDMAPDLAVEVISKGNTTKEMDRKLVEYFQAGSKLVWYVYPKTKTVEVYTAPEQKMTLAETEVLTGVDVLPGLEIKLIDLFKLPVPKEA